MSTPGYTPPPVIYGNPNLDPNKMWSEQNFVGWKPQSSTGYNPWAFKANPFEDKRNKMKSAYDNVTKNANYVPSRLREGYSKASKNRYDEVMNMYDNVNTENATNLAQARSTAQSNSGVNYDPFSGGQTATATATPTAGPQPASTHPSFSTTPAPSPTNTQQIFIGYNSDGVGIPAGSQKDRSGTYWITPNNQMIKV